MKQKNFFSDHVFHSSRGILSPNVCCRHAGQVPPTYICRPFSRNSLSTFSERFSWCSAAAAWAWLRWPLPAYSGPPPTLRRYYLAAISSIKCSEAASSLLLFLFSFSDPFSLALLQCAILFSVNSSSQEIRWPDFVFKCLTMIRKDPGGHYVFFPYARPVRSWCWFLQMFIWPKW